MYSHFEPLLRELDEKPQDLADAVFRERLRLLPLIIFGNLLWKTPEFQRYRNLLDALPDLPSEQILGAAEPLSRGGALRQATDQFRVIEAAVALLTGPLSEATTVLDYGCNWGRLTRFFLRYGGQRQLYVADVSANLETLPQHFPVRRRLLADDIKLPSGKIDVALIFSRFTEIPDFALARTMERLAPALKPSGGVIFCVRPLDYWWHLFERLKEERYAQAAAVHKDVGYVHLPLPGSGMLLAGEAGYSHDYLINLLPRWQFIRTELVPGDPFKVLYIARLKRVISVHA